MPTMTIPLIVLASSIASSLKKALRTSSGDVLTVEVDEANSSLCHISLSDPLSIDHTIEVRLEENSGVECWFGCTCSDHHDTDALVERIIRKEMRRAKVDAALINMSC